MVSEAQESVSGLLAQWFMRLPLSGSWVCSPEVLTALEVLFPGSFSYMWTSAYGGSQHDFSQSEWQEKMPKTEVAVFYTLFSEVTYHHFCCMTLIIEIDPSNMVKGGRQLYKGVKTRRWGSLGSSWKLATIGITNSILLMRNGCSERFNEFPRFCM